MLGCGGHRDECWCNEECSEYDDCCADYQAVCANGAPTPPPPASFALGRFRLTGTWALPEVEDNLSGVLVLPATDGPSMISLLLVTNDPTELRQYKVPAAGAQGAMQRAPTVVQTIQLDGFEDTEGICIGPNGNVLVTEERRRNIVRLPRLPDASGGHISTVSRDSAEVFHTNIATQSANKGIEGVAFDPASGLAFAVVEKQPMRVLVLNVSSGASAEVADLFDAEASLHGVATDLAGVAFLPAQGDLVLLSQESKHLLRVSPDGGLVEPPFALAGTQPRALPSQRTLLPSLLHLSQMSFCDTTSLHERI